jgi:hypothetical protein
MQIAKNGLRDQFPTRFFLEKGQRSGVKGTKVLQCSVEDFQGEPMLW